MSGYGDAHKEEQIRVLGGAGYGSLSLGESLAGVQVPIALGTRMICSQGRANGLCSQGKSGSSMLVGVCEALRDEATALAEGKHGRHCRGRQGKAKFLVYGRKK